MRHRRDRPPPFWFLRRRKADVEREIDEEIETHLAMRIEEFMQSGWTEADARREALRRFGSRQEVERGCAQEDRMKATRVQWRLRLTDAVQDLKFCLRSLLRARRLAGTIVLTVGLGIGLTTAMFGAVFGVLVRPLPYQEPERLVRIYTDAPPHRYNFSVADYLTLDREQTQFETVAGYVDRTMIFADTDASELVQGRVVTWTYFDLLGIRPELGRGFGAADSQLQNPPTAIVTHAFWRDRLGGRTDAVGESVTFDGAQYLLVGVLPRGVGPLEHGREFFLAARWTPPARKGPFFINALGRLRAGDDRAKAASELRLINTRMFPVWKASYQDDRASWGLVDLKTDLVGDTRTLASVAVAAVGLMWLIACANASSLLLARVTSRRRELAVRAALGASRARLVRLLLAEGALLAAGAASIGLGVAWTGIRLLREAGAAYVPRAEEIALDPPTLWVCAALTGASALLCGLIPALQGSGYGIDESLRASSRSATDSARARVGRRVLVGTQFAVATPLLILAALLLVSLHRLQQVDLGFETQNLVTAAIRLPGAQYQDEARVRNLWTELEERAAGLPGVSSAAFADGRPPNGVGNFNNFDLERFPTPAGQSQPVTPWVAVTPAYFRTLGLSLLEGRLLDARDALPSSPDVVVVDRAWARRFFPNQAAVGQRLKGGGCTSCDWTTVVGVVNDVKYAGLDKPDEGSVYTPLVGGTSRYLFVRTTVDASGVLPLVRDLLRNTDASIALSSEATIDDLVAISLQVPTSLSWLIGALAAAALLLSTIGIYGVMSHYVEAHARDMSIRLALGGTPGAVARHVLRHGMAVVVTGVAAGVAIAAALTQFVASLLFGVSAVDPIAFVGVPGLLIVVAFLACARPSHRAVSMDPAMVLRSE
jgi:predicted permease